MIDDENQSITSKTMTTNPTIMKRMKKYLKEYLTKVQMKNRKRSTLIIRWISQTDPVAGHTSYSHEKYGIIVIYTQHTANHV
jgi:hypothetical protein